MAKHIGVTLPEDLRVYLESGKAIATLATFSEKGLPHTTPLQCIVPKGDESLLMAINKEHDGYHNMVWQKKIMLSFMGPNNISYSILGRAGVVRAPSQIHPLMNIVRIDIIDIRCDRSILFNITSGVQWEYTSSDSKDLVESLTKELKDLAKSL